MLAFLVVAGAMGCGGSDKLTPPSTNLSGTWQIVDTPTTTNCPGGLGSASTYSMMVNHQAGSNSFLAVGSSLGSASGTIDGSKVSFSGSASASGCTSLAVTVNMTVDSTGNAATGSSSWTCSYTGGSCSGTDSVSATRQPLPAGVSTFCSKMVSCALVTDEAACAQLAPLLAPMLPDPTYFAACVNALSCSDLLNQTKVQACVDLDNATTVCSGSTTLHVCSHTNHLCVDVSCPMVCGYVGYSAVGCSYDSTKQHDVCLCG